MVDLPTIAAPKIPSMSIGVTELLMIELILFNFILFGFVIWFYFRVMRYNIKIHILERTAGMGVMISHDNAQIKKDAEGKIYLQLKRLRKIPLPMVDTEQFTGFRGFFKRGALFLAKVNEITYIPLQINDTWQNSPFNVPNKFMDVDDYNSAIMEQIMIRNKYKKDNLIITILPWAVMFILLIGVGIIFKYGIDKISTIAPIMDSAAGKISTSVDKLVPFLQDIANR